MQNKFKPFFFAILFLGVLGVANISLAYDPPIGIPDPGMWGSTHPIDSSAPAQPAEWPSAQVAGYYYIDNTHPQATDTGNTYGYPDKPRMTIPTTYAAGAYVEIHGGPYTGGQLIITANGIASQPVWIRGMDSATKPVIKNLGVIIKGSYVILENIYFDNSIVGLRVHSNSNLHHAVVRNNEFLGSGANVGNSAVVGIYGSSGNIFSDIVVYNNVIHNFGDLTSATENDFHGVAPSAYADRVWVLNNHIYNLGGDSIQVGAASLAVEARPNHTYVGGNNFHDNRENCVDIKQADNIIVSQNIMHGAQGASSDPGGVVVVHNSPTNVWILNNEIYDGNEGTTSTGSSGFYVIGNRIYKIHRAVATAAGGTADTRADASVYRSGIGIKYYATTGAYLANNTIDDVLIGIAGQLTLAGDVSTWVNNIVSNVDLVDGGYHLIMNGSSAGLIPSILQNTILFQSGESIRNSATSFGQVTALSQNIDPKLVDTVTQDFHLQNGSPAINSGVTPDLINIFQSLYGLSIAYDRDSTPRPQGSAWDIGAYEYVSGDGGGDTIPPSAPSGLSVN